MGLFDFFKKKQNIASGSEKVEESSITGNAQQPSGTNSNNIESDEIIVQELEVGDFGGSRPSLTLRKSGRIYLIVEVPPFYDGDGNEIDGDEDFPEVFEFENLISEYAGVQVDRDDREVFRIDNPKPDTLSKVKDFIENYWVHRKEQYKKRKEPTPGEMNIFPIDKKKIYPIIKGVTGKDSAIQSENIEAPISNLLLDNLSVLYAVDTGGSFAYLNKSMLAKIGLPIDQLAGLAKSNLSRYVESKEITIQGDGDIFMIKFDQNMESSLLLVEEFWLQFVLQLNDDLVIAAPSREILLVTSKSNTAAITQLRTAATELYSSGRYKLTNKLLLRTINGKLLVFE